MKSKLSAATLRGIFPAIPTPVNDDDSVDRNATKLIVNHLLKAGVHGIVPLGGTGEYGALPRESRIEMAEICAETAAGRVPVVAGVLDTGFYDALSAGKAFAAAGVDGLMLVTPYYTVPSQRGIRDYFMRYADASPVPIMLYEIPYRTRISIDASVIHELSRHENIIGMKSCNPDMYHFLRIAAGISDSFNIFSGEDTIFPLHMVGGAKGAVVVAATVLPRTWLKLYELLEAGETSEAMALHRTLIPLIDTMFAETNPGPIKSIMDMIGIPTSRVLDPLRPPAPELVAKLRDILSGLLPSEVKLSKA